ncbi:HAMP domain-containing protein [Myxococcus sp. AM009]|uniref:sensor histidine kinase n=1 Tax=unclassified Myxococcus TaxID=2648731 RepID=UPI00159536DA|nr:MULTISPECIES: sensor histidine kinase [unclassified Myxococcus]NVI97019.1 HAMP domain-containing protein [Myxococcus sp. AM009]NVJ12842.1 HAMP domain-containing protein [Myxococcus sp. AM010]
MRLYQQLVLFMLAATVLPLAAVGFLLLSRAEAELAARIDAEQRAQAVATAESVGATLMEVVDALARSAELIDWQAASDAETQGALRLLYGQSPAVSAVLKLDAEGRPLGAPVFRARPIDGHPAFSPESVDRLVRSIPVQALRGGGKGQAALGSAYVHSDEGRSAVAVAVKLAEGEGAPFAVAEVVLHPLEAVLRRRLGEGLGRIDLVDEERRVLASTAPERRGQALAPELSAHLLAPAAALTERVRSFRVESPARRVSVARVPHGMRFDVLVEVEESTALAPVHDMRRTVLLSIGATFLVLLGLGALFTRRLNVRLAEVVRGAEAYGRGELDTRLKVSGQDELSELATTFNRMGEELEAARARMLSWNDDLRVRVEEATAELRAAQAQLVEAQKLAAVGQLGAGVAHEINNPLAGILGNVQLLMLDRGAADPDLESLRKIEQSAKRCKEITQNLLRFSQQRERAELRPVDLNAVVRDALSLTEHQLRGDGVALTSVLGEGLARVRGDPGHLSQVVLALVSNARTAMLKSPQKRLTLRTGEANGFGFLEVEDTGKGIAPHLRPRIFEPFFTTKDVWSNVGLGLSVAWRVVTEAGGSIEVRSEVEQGSCFTVKLPKA